MSDCCKHKKVKNPCIVCKNSVSHKTGLQCNGSCKSWIHYTCCNYTPGKIKDIKAKIIKIRCPCPGCTTEGPKEIILKQSSVICMDKVCPAYLPHPGKSCGAHGKSSQQTTSVTGLHCPSHQPSESHCGLPCLICKSHQVSCSPQKPATKPSNITLIIASISIVENMCETVGHLSEQLNQLMAKMTDALDQCP